MALVREFGKIARKLAQRGPRFVWAYLKEVALFDLVHGTDTRGRKPDNSRTAESIYYVPSFTTVIEETLALVRGRLGAAFADHRFLDIGCGKGKAILIYLRQYGGEARFAPIGIEYDAELCAIARRNLLKSGFGSRGAEVVHDDALNVRAHVGAEPLILFLYNPFFGHLFHEFVATLESVPHVLIYMDPIERAHLLEHGYRIDAEHAGRYNADTWIVASKPTAWPSN